jgi:DNA replication licensing factor MCM3
VFRKKLAHLFATSLQDEEQMIFTELLELVNQGLPTDELFGTAEATAACNAMGEANELMLSDGIVYKI